MLTPGVGQNLQLLVKRFGKDQAREMYGTSLNAVRYVGELARQERLEFGLQMTGQLVVARGHAGRTRLAKQAALMQQLELPCETLDDRGLAKCLSLNCEAPGAGPAALRLPVAGVLDPGRLVRGLAVAVERRGGRIIENTQVESIVPSGVRLADGRIINAKKVVVATNGYDVSLGVQHGRLLPLHLRMILTQPLTTEQLSGLNWQWRGGVIDSRRVFNYFRLTDDNRLLLGGGLPRYQWQGNSQDLPSNGQDTDRLIDDLRQLFPSLTDLEIERSWTGVIAYSLDTLPAIGHVAGLPNVIHVGGWCGHGIALSVCSGRWVSAMVNGGTVKSRPWFRGSAPRVPTEVARWTGIQVGGWATQLLDRVA